MTEKTLPGTERALRGTSPAPVHVIGLGLPFSGKNDSPDFSRCLRHPLLEAADVLIGGRAQLAAFAGHPAEKLLVGADAAKLYDAIEKNRQAGRRQVVLCGGDPLYFGLGARLAERFGREALHILPGISSLQAATAFLGLAWENVESVSLHGRISRLALAHALMRAQAAKRPIFVLADAFNHPAAVAAFMKERGYAGGVMHVLGNLHFVLHEGGSQNFDLSMYSEPLPAGNGRKNGTFPAEIRAEFAASLTVEEALTLPEKPLGAERALQLVMLLEPQRDDDGTAPMACPFGIPDEGFAAEGELLTKGPVRAASLAALAVEPGHTVWDLGAGSGAVSVEAARLAWQGRVVAVEARAGRIALIEENRRRFGAANLEIVPGMMPGILEHCEALYPQPERIIIGGGLGGAGGADEAVREAAAQTFSAAWKALRPGGRMLVHCALLSTLEFARAELAKRGAAAQVTCIQASRSESLAGDMRLAALNPVFLASAEKR